MTDDTKTDLEGETGGNLFQLARLLSQPAADYKERLLSALNNVRERISTDLVEPWQTNNEIEVLLCEVEFYTERKTIYGWAINDGEKWRCFASLRELAATVPGRPMADVVRVGGYYATDGSVSMITKNMVGSPQRVLEQLRKYVTKLQDKRERERIRDSEDALKAIPALLQQIQKQPEYKGRQLQTWYAVQTKEREKKAPFMHDTKRRPWNLSKTATPGAFCVLLRVDRDGGKPVIEDPLQLLQYVERLRGMAITGASYELTRYSRGELSEPEIANLLQKQLCSMLQGTLIDSFMHLGIGDAQPVQDPRTHAITYKINNAIFVVRSRPGSGPVQYTDRQKRILDAFQTVENATATKENKQICKKLLSEGREKEVSRQYVDNVLNGIKKKQTGTEQVTWNTKRVLLFLLMKARESGKNIVQASTEQCANYCGWNYKTETSRENTDRIIRQALQTLSSIEITGGERSGRGKRLEGVALGGTHSLKAGTITFAFDPVAAAAFREAAPADVGLQLFRADERPGLLLWQIGMNYRRNEGKPRQNKISAETLVYCCGVPDPRTYKRRHAREDIIDPFFAAMNKITHIKYHVIDDFGNVIVNPQALDLPELLKTTFVFDYQSAEYPKHSERVASHTKHVKQVRNAKQAARLKAIQDK